MDDRDAKIVRLAALARDEGVCNPIKLKFAAEARDELASMGVRLDADGWPIGD